MHYPKRVIQFCSDQGTGCLPDGRQIVGAFPRACGPLGDVSVQLPNRLEDVRTDHVPGVGFLRGRCNGRSVHQITLQGFNFRLVFERSANSLMT